MTRRKINAEYWRRSPPTAEELRNSRHRVEDVPVAQRRWLDGYYDDETSFLTKADEAIYQDMLDGYYDD